MKEATGEANMTVVTIILIAVIVAVATPIVNSYMATTAKRACCMNDGGTWTSEGKCSNGKDYNRNCAEAVTDGQNQGFGA